MKFGLFGINVGPCASPGTAAKVALAFVAAHTTRLRLATGIIILPQRNPVVLARSPLRRRRSA